MINKFLLTSLLLLSTFTVFAQQPLTEDLIKNKLLTPYDNYFSADREMIYTQFNKSRYVLGDDVWFTAWILNPLNKRLSFNTTKLYVELWTAEKKMISRKIIPVKGGTGSNYIHIDDTLAPGTYCFRAYTSWMRNFYDEKDFNVPITVIGSTVKTLRNTASTIAKKPSVVVRDPAKQTSKQEYDIQFLPESGHFIQGLDNVIGVKVTDSYGHGVVAQGKVVDSLNNELVTFTTNQLGMTSFTLIEAPRQSLKSTITLPNGVVREVVLPHTEPQGVVLHVNAYMPKQVWIRLQANELTRSLHQDYVLMIHANGVMFGNYKIGFQANNSVQVKINKKDIGNGVVYATLFNQDFKPVSERIFYNQSDTIQGKLTMSLSPAFDDSVKLTVTATDSLAKPQISKLSLTILPDGTTMNRFTSNMLAESRLRPALKGDIENAAWYFEQNKRERNVALDNLLIIQGWRKYDWMDIEKNAKKPFAYPAEQGFSINGAVKNWIRNRPEQKSRISLLSPDNKIFGGCLVDSAGQFHFNNLYLADSTYVIASASSVKGANWNRTLALSIPEATLNTPEFNQILAGPANEVDSTDDVPKLTKGVIRLAEVVVSARRKDPFADNIYVGIMSKQFTLTKENYVQFSDIQQVLSNVFNIIVQTDENGKTIFNMGRATSTLRQNPAMVIDGVRVMEPMELLSFPLNMVDAIAVDKTGTGGGMSGGNGVIAITSRTTPLFDMPSESTNLKRMTIKGYSAPQKYFEPKYLIQAENPDFSKYATVYWKPELVTGADGSASFTFRAPKPINSLIIKAEGINYTGLIFEHQEKIRIKDRE